MGKDVLNNTYYQEGLPCSLHTVLITDNKDAKIPDITKESNVRLVQPEIILGHQCSAESITGAIRLTSLTP